MASLRLPSSPKPLISIKKPRKTSIKAQTSTAHLKISTKSYFHQISSLCKQGQLQQAFTLLSQMETNSLPIGPEIYGELLQGCVYERALSQGQQIHSRIIKNGSFFHKNEYIEAKVLIFYAKCGCVATAEKLFVRQCGPNVFSWAAMIGLHSRHGYSEKALLGFVNMMEAGGAFPDNFVIPNVLKSCSALRSVGFGKGVHGYVIKMGFGDCVYVLSSLVDFYGKCGVLEDARRVFGEIPERNVVTWNSMVVGFLQNGMNEEALEMFCDMRVDGVEPTRVSVSSFLSASANLEAVDEGRQGHALAVVLGLELDSILGTSIMNFYCKVGLVEDAVLVFDQMIDRDVVTWNLLISGYAQDGQIEKALHTCHCMRKEGLKFDSVTLASIISACADSGEIELGRVGHGYCIRNNLEQDLVVASSTMDLYASVGRIECAQRVFDVTCSRDLVLWNTLISAYAQYGLSGEALRLFYQMQLEGVPSNVISYNLVILGFLRNGQVEDAQDLFLQMQLDGLNPTIITWTTLIFGFAQNGFGYKAIQLFKQMLSTDLKPNAISILGVLLACTNSVSLGYGRVVHGHVMRRGLLSSISVVTSLVDMYSKCGSIMLAKKIFEMVPKKELPLYNVMISGLSLHGQAAEALTLYEHMQCEGMEPDSITFTGLLSACSHAGLVDKGLKVFMEMVSKYHITPQKEHYGCAVTLLARCGNFKEAMRVLSAMPLNADAHMLGSLLAACNEHREIELGEYLSSCLLKLEPTNSVNYVTLANTYAASGRWRKASKVRALMKEIGLKKNPGCSWVHIGNELHTFIVGNKSHPQIDAIFETLMCLHREMKFGGCAPTELNSRLMDGRREVLCS